MFHLKTLATAALATAFSVAVPTFAMADSHSNRGHDTHSNRGQVERRVETRHVETRHVESHRVEPRHNRVIVERDHVIRDFHRDHYDHHYYDHGFRFGVGINVAPVYPVYPAYPTYPADCDIAMSLADVPGAVLDAATRECGGAIDSVRLIRHDGVEYFRVIVNGRDGLFEVHVDGAGRLLSVGRL